MERGALKTNIKITYRLIMSPFFIDEGEKYK